MCRRIIKSFIETASSVVTGWLLPSLMCAFALLAAGTANAATVSIVSDNAVDSPNYDLTNTYGIGDWAYWFSGVAGGTSSADPDNAKFGGSLIGPMTPVGTGVVNGSTSTTVPVYDFDFTDGTSPVSGTASNLIRHSPDDIQLRGNCTAVPPPRELYPLCSHPMA